jgi:hypothetical protein
MRGTLHLVTADDCLLLRPLVQPVLDRELAAHRDHAPALQGVDLEPILAFARPLLAERPRTGNELRAALQEQFPDLSAAALAYACRNHLAFVQVPPRGVWGRSSQVTSTTAEAWLGRPLVVSPSIDEVIRRYLAAFGPATPADASAWCRLTGLREVFERLRPGLRTFRDERGRELFDLPDAPRPDAATPAPPRFLPEYDNLLLSHEDRGRFVAPAHPTSLWAANRPIRGAVLHDGFAFGTWQVNRDRDTGTATLLVEHSAPARAATRHAIEHEGRRLLGLLAGDAAGHHVTFEVRSPADG